MASPNGLELTWSKPATNYVYTVQYRDALVGSNWTGCPPANQWPTQTNRWTDPGVQANRARFYRVIAQPASGVERGKLLAFSVINRLTTNDIALFALISGLPIVAEQEVVVYKLVYETVDAFNAKTTASGAFALPQTVQRALPLVTYQHGTLVKKTDAPSNLGLEAMIGVAFATTGYAAAVPDYLGLGDSPGFHPYHHAKSEATAVTDMLRASRAFCASNAIPLNAQLFLCGYSQGGHATMAAHKEIETEAAAEFTITASAPMAGAYDMSGVTTADFLSNRVMPNPYYFAYLMAAYQYVYHLGDSLAQFLVDPYAATVPPLFDGLHSSGDINQVMPAIPHQILKPDYLLSFQNDPNHPLRAALRDNDLYNWKPVSPMHLYHCHGDHDVLYANSETAYNSFLNLGATQVQLIDPKPDADHSTGAIYCLQAAKSWFDGLKQ